MPITKRLTLESIDSSNDGEFDALLNQVMAEGMKQVRADCEKLESMGVLDSQGNLLVKELPEEMREGSQRDFGG